MNAGQEGEFYRCCHAWFLAHPRALRALLAVSRWLVRLVYAGYILLCAVLALHRDLRIVRVLVVPAAVFLAGTALRAAINAPRPYEVLNLPPLAPKETKGKSFPSRHVFCAAVISMAFWYCNVPLGAGFCLAAAGIAACRVLSGVHWSRDVLAGLALGWAAGIIGFFAL